MKQYLLDTNIVAFLIRGRQEVIDKVLAVGIDNCHISEMTYGELLYGVACSSNPTKNSRALESFVNGLDILPLKEVWSTFAQCKCALRKIGRLVDDADILIGSTAIAYKMVMVTEKTRHFENMPGIKFENWIKRPL